MLPAVHCNPSGNKLRLKIIKTETSARDPRLSKSLHLHFVHISRHLMLGSINQQTARERGLNTAEGTLHTVTNHNFATGISPLSNSFINPSHSSELNAFNLSHPLSSAVRVLCSDTARQQRHTYKSEILLQRK